jgi:hypothetical protein
MRYFLFSKFFIVKLPMSFLGEIYVYLHWKTKAIMYIFIVECALFQELKLTTLAKSKKKY